MRMKLSQANDISMLLKVSMPIGVDLAMLFFTFFIDTWFLSRQSELSAAAVGALFSLFGLISMALRQIAQAGAVVVAFHKGAGADDGATRFVTFWNGAALGILSGLLVLLGSGTIPAWIGLKGDAANIASVYLLTIAPGMLFLSFKYTFASLNLAERNTGPQMWSGFAAVVLNIILNYIFIEWSTFGNDAIGQTRAVATATVISYLANAGLLWRAVESKGELLKVWQLPLVWQALAMIWRKAVPTVIEPAAIQIQWLFLTVIVAGLGLESLAARIYVINYQMFVLTWSLAISIAVQVLTSEASGRGDRREVSRTMALGNWLGAGGALIVTGCMYLLSNVLISPFTMSEQILATASVLFLIAIPTEMAKAVYNTTCWTLVGTGDHRFPVLLSIVILFGLGLPLAYVLAVHFNLGIVGVWAALAVDEIVRALIMLLRWHYLAGPRLKFRPQEV